MYRRTFGFALVGSLLLGGFVSAENTTTEQTRQAITKSLELIQHSTKTYRQERTCFSCHHQTMPILTIIEAKVRGFDVDEKDLRAQLERTSNHLENGRKRYLEGRGQGGRVDTANYALWALEAGEYEPDKTTEAVVEYLLKTDSKLGRWRGTTSRPPTQTSDITRTALALRAMDIFGTEKQAERIAERKKLAREWLLKVQPKDTEDQVFRIQALDYLGEDAKTLRPFVEDLLSEQREDGGWAQKPDMKSDAYATGSVMVTLHEAGNVPVTDSAYRRGVKYLLDTQHEDGSWHVKTRTRVIQKYFESGFPHKKDQFISMSATAWATQALLLTTSRKEDKSTASGE